MKIKLTLIVLVLISMMSAQVTKSEAQTQVKPVTIFDEIFKVPGPGHPKNKPQNGLERPFTIAKNSTVSLTIVSSNKKPALNVYLLDEDNYSKYKNSGSLMNLTSVEGFSKMNTLGYEKSGDLTAGKYVLLMRWAEVGLFVKQPAVGLKLIAQEITSIQTPTITPVKKPKKKPMVVLTPTPKPIM